MYHWGYVGLDASQSGAFLLVPALFACDAGQCRLVDHLFVLET